jgi:hypothetical protein
VFLDVEVGQGKISLDLLNNAKDFAPSPKEIFAAIP